MDNTNVLYSEKLEPFRKNFIQQALTELREEFKGRCHSLTTQGQLENIYASYRSYGISHYDTLHFLRLSYLPFSERYPSEQAERYTRGRSPHSLAQQYLEILKGPRSVEAMHVAKNAKKWTCQDSQAFVQGNFNEVGR